MPYAVTVPAGSGHVLVTVEGPYSRELSIEIALASKEVAAAHGLHRFLWDVRRSRNVETVVANYEFVHRDMPPLDLDRAAHVAILVAPDDHSHDFVETVSINAGYSVRIFRDEQEALCWLRT